MNRANFFPLIGEGNGYYPGMGVARMFQRGGHTDSYRGYSSDCHLNIVSCLLTRRLTKGGVTGTPGPPLAYAYARGLLAAICTGNVTENIIELIVFAVLFSFR